MGDAAQPASHLASAFSAPVSLAVGLDPTALVGLDVPLARSRLDRSPTRAEAAAGLANIADVSREGVARVGLGIGVTSTNPGDVGPNTIAPLGALRPHAVAETPTPRTARSEAGLVVQALGLSLSSDGMTEVRADGSGSLIAHAVSEIPLIQLVAVEVHGLRSDIRMEVSPDGPPLVTYSLLLTTLRLGETEVGDARGEIVLRGDRVPVGELRQQFERERHRLASLLAALHLDPLVRIQQPQVATSTDGQTTLTGPIVEVHLGSGESRSIASLRLGSAVVSVAVGSRSMSSAPTTLPPIPQLAPPGVASTPSSPSPAQLSQTTTSASVPDGTPAPSGGARRRHGSVRRRRAAPAIAAAATSRLLPVVVMGAAGLNALLLISRALGRMGGARGSMTARDGSS